MTIGHELATARFVSQREDALFLGAPGTGKSRLALGARDLGAGVELRYVSPSPEVLIGRIHCRARATGTFYVITVRVSSESQGRPQRETDVETYLIDGRGRRLDVSAAGQEALQRAGLAGPPVTSVVEPGGAFESRRAFDVPLDATDLGFVKASHRGFPRRVIIGDPESFLHRPTVVRLDAR